MTINSYRAARLASKSFRMAAAAFASPFHGIAWVGNQITSRLFTKLDRTPIGDYIAPRAYRIGGPSFVVGDMGFIGYALEQGNHLQLSGALATPIAHGILALLGDKNPLILEAMDQLSSLPHIGPSISKLRPVVEALTKKDHLIVPAAWTFLAYNGFSIAAGATTKPNHDVIAKTEEQLLQLYTQIAPVIHNPPFLKALESAVHNPETAYLAHEATRAPEFMQGLAILVGCLGLAANQYLNRSNERATDRSQEERDAIHERAERIGHFAVGILTSCTLLTFATGMVDMSPSLLLCSTPGFLLGNYCQNHMRRGQAPLRELKS